MKDCKKQQLFSLKELQYKALKQFDVNILLKYFFCPRVVLTERFNPGFKR